jgi:hypothetical protein
MGRNVLSSRIGESSIEDCFRKCPLVLVLALGTERKSRAFV